ncbi:L-2,4-diaminobutyric acid acetyltransferase [Oceanicola granulosus HTCC2516]|uniref:L-2,4-diaminobutyric acid acetyltransferase n=1 Tax=Oceanicola granulosus (strain ATCC BAA-861 / DSM 15982 / KCTC 12143 / HTCC2516) TaxID=314256 RepID=Q2CFH4_OCEGH|nr:diaminobutyrate acetyltransferase [Oceanicola granulosus]EAR51508.1 L-2,4-diaminobutyric acid acetyltransferase [Oceanicola granulosus HTCC2516]
MDYALERARKTKATLRRPTPEDGAAVWELVAACKPLDENSMYMNLVQCDHFRDTCVLAEMDGEVVGWVSGHIPPADPETLFVWQVAVSEKARGQGLGGRMLAELVARDVCDDVNQMKTTITKDNDASWSLFRRFSRRFGGQIEDEPHFTKADHFRGAHDTEHMVTIKLEDAADAKAA